MEIQPLMSGYSACKAGRSTRDSGSSCSFPAGKTPELSAPGRGCAYSVFRACASPLVSPGCRTKNQRSPNKLRHKRPMQNPFRKIFILLCLDPHRPDQQICAFYLYSAGKAERRRTKLPSLPECQGWQASTGYRRSAEQREPPAPACYASLRSLFRLP